MSRGNNEITNKMLEQTQVNTNNVEDPLRIITKYLKKVEQGYRLAEWNHKNKEKLAQEAKAHPNEAHPDEAQKSNLSYSIGTVIVIGLLGILGYYISKKGNENDIKVISVETQKCANKFEME